MEKGLLRRRLILRLLKLRKKLCSIILTVRTQELTNKKKRQKKVFDSPIHGQVVSVQHRKTWVTGSYSKNTSLKLNWLITHPRIKQTKISGKRRIALTIILSEGQTVGLYQATNRRAGKEYSVIYRLRTI